jgi:hypothetical protein
MKSRIKYLVVFVPLLATVGTGIFVFCRGFSAEDEPPSVEAFVARRSRLLAIPRHAR